MPDPLIAEELVAGLADEVDRHLENKPWWNYVKAILFYGPAVLIAIYLSGFFLGTYSRETIDNRHLLLFTHDFGMVGRRDLLRPHDIVRYLG